MSISEKELTEADLIVRERPVGVKEEEIEEVLFETE